MRDDFIATVAPPAAEPAPSYQEPSNPQLQLLAADATTPAAADLHFDEDLHDPYAETDTAAELDAHADTEPGIVASVSAATVADASEPVSVTEPAAQAPTPVVTDAGRPGLGLFTPAVPAVPSVTQAPPASTGPVAEPPRRAPRLPAGRFSLPVAAFSVPQLKRRTIAVALLALVAVIGALTVSVPARHRATPQQLAPAIHAAPMPASSPRRRPPAKAIARRRRAPRRVLRIRTRVVRRTVRVPSAPATSVATAPAYRPLRSPTGPSEFRP